MLEDNMKRASVTDQLQPILVSRGQLFTKEVFLVISEEVSKAVRQQHEFYVYCMCGKLVAACKRDLKMEKKEIYNKS